MGKSKKQYTVTSKILISLLTLSDTVLVTPHELKRRWFRGDLLGDSQSVTKTIYYLTQKGYLKYVNEENEKFIKITKKGELKALLEKSKLEKEESEWDGKWRIIIFDIPEESNGKRNFFRALLKQYGYKRLQGSVYISPWPLNRSAVDYLKQTGLNKYIRIIKAEEIDDDTDLKKEFNVEFK